MDITYFENTNFCGHFFIHVKRLFNVGYFWVFDAANDSQAPHRKSKRGVSVGCYVVVGRVSLQLLVEGAFGKNICKRHPCILLSAG